MTNRARKDHVAPDFTQQAIHYGAHAGTDPVFYRHFADQLAPHDPNEYHPDARLQAPEWFPED